MELPQGSPPRIPQELLPSPRNSPEVPGPPPKSQELSRGPRTSPGLPGKAPQGSQELPQDRRSSPGISLSPLSNEGTKNN